jgi:hypothetical protein
VRRRLTGRQRVLPDECLADPDGRLTVRFAIYLGTTMTIDVTAEVRTSHLRDSQFGEILVIRQDEDQLKADVYCALGLADYPAGRWRSLDPQSLARELGVPRVCVHGPLLWAVDALTFGAASRTLCVDGIDARLTAELTFPPGTTVANAGIAPYRDLVVAPAADYVFCRGRPLYKLQGPGGERYNMLAYSRSIDDDLSAGSLTGLAHRLQVAEGWRYCVASPVQDLVMRPASGQVRLVHDELQNAYLLQPSTPRPQASADNYATARPTVSAAFRAKR